jgi:prolyl-tRNA editing enzyme YbaK/EbsC (Cys-tRNA(Pro) deacylase)
LSAPGRSQALKPEPFTGEGATATGPGRSQALEPEPFKSEGLPVTERPEGFRRVAHALAQAGHPHPPLWLEVPARTSQEAADALGVTVGQIAKSVIFRRKSDNAAVLVVTSGDRRVDERRVAVHTGPLGRADAEFVKASTGFSIGGVAPLAHAGPVLTLIDRELFRFDEVWAAAGHPNGVFRLSPQALQQLTGAPVADVVQEAEA